MKHLKTIIVSVIFALLCLPLYGAAEFDLRKGLDMVGTNRISASALNQLVDNGTTATNKGMVIRKTTRPDVSNNPRYTNFLWLDTSLGLPGTLKQYVCCGDADTNWVAGVLGAASISSAMLQEGSVIAGKIGAAAVVSSNLFPLAVGSAALNDGSVTSNKLSSSSVTSDKIVDGTISTVDIGTNQITTALIAPSAVTTALISPASITSNLIAAANVTSDKLPITGVGLDRLSTNGGTAYQTLSLNSAGTGVTFAVPVMLQWTNRVNTNNLTTATVMPAINPTTAGGALLTSIAFTPKRSDSVLYIRASAAMTLDTSSGYLVLAVFNNSSGAIMAMDASNAAIQEGERLLAEAFAPNPGAGVTTTYVVRYGSSAGANAYVNWNGATAALPVNSFLSIQEVFQYPCCQ